MSIVDVEPGRTNLKAQIDALCERMRQGEIKIGETLRAGDDARCNQYIDHWCKLLRQYEAKVDAYVQEYGEME
jgi:hypothetical protein